MEAKTVNEEELDQHRTNVIARHLAREDAREVSCDCPVCHEKRAANPGEVCVSCAVGALRRGGWIR